MGIKDPIEHWTNVVKEMNFNESKGSYATISNDNNDFNLGYSLIKNVFDFLELTPYLNTQNKLANLRCNLSDFISQLIYAMVVDPCSKLQTVDCVFPMLYDTQNISLQQVYDGIEFIGEYYDRFVGLFNIAYERKFKRNTNNVFFNCTNYYFEIDVPKNDKQKETSNKRNANPIIGQTILLDADQIPLSMRMYPDNKSDKQYLQKIIEEMKEECNIKGRTIQVANRGLNCASNIHSAIKNGDGYVFSKSVDGINLNDEETKWILDENGWENIVDNQGTVLFKVKEKVCKVNYKYTNENNEIVNFTTEEKMVVSYNPTLAKKKQIEIQEMFDDSLWLTTIKADEENEYDSYVKYVDFKTVDELGNEIKIEPKLNEKVFAKDMMLAGYNLMVTSEIKNSGKQFMIFIMVFEKWKNHSK